MSHFRFCLMGAMSLAVLFSAPTFSLAVGEGDVNNPYCWFTSWCAPFTTDKTHQVFRCETKNDVQGIFQAAPYRYRVNGTCTLIERNDSRTTFDADRVLATMTWTADGTYHPTSRNTTEVVAITSQRGRVVSKGTISASRSCPKDPWRERSDRCGPARSDTSGTVDPAAYTGYVNSYVPVSSNLTNEARALLQQQYMHAMQIQQLQRAQNTPAGATAKSLPSLAQRASNAGVSQGATQAPILLGPLTITLPLANSRAVQGKLQVNAAPPAGFTDINSANAMLEFTWLDTPSATKYVNTYPIALTVLLKGHLVPEGVTRGQIGRWQVRARITSPALGAWSAAVPFVLALQ